MILTAGSAINSHQKVIETRNDKIMDNFSLRDDIRRLVGTCTERLLHDHKPLLETIRMQARFDLIVY